MSPWARCASAAICSTAAAISATRSETCSTASPMRSNASRVRATVATPSSVRSAACETTPTTVFVCPWISPIRPAI
jgi:hypothetical protein